MLVDKQQNELIKSYFRARAQADEAMFDEGFSNNFQEHEKYYILNQSNQFQKYVYKNRMTPIENSPYFAVDMDKIEESEFYFNGYQIWPTLKIVNEHFHDVDPKKVDPNAFFNSIKDLPKYHLNTDDYEDVEYYWDDPNKKTLIQDVKRFFRGRNEDDFADRIEDVIPRINAIVLRNKERFEAMVVDFNKKPMDLTKYDISLDNLDSYSLETPYIRQKIGDDSISYTNKLKNGTYLVGGDMKGDPETLYNGYIIDKNFNDAKDKLNIQDLSTNGDIWFASSALVGKPIKVGELKTINGVPQLIIKDKDDKKYVARMSDDEFKIEVIEIPSHG